MIPTLLLAAVSLAQDPSPEDLQLVREAPDVFTMEARPDWIVRHASGSAMTTEQFLRVTDGKSLYLQYRETQKRTATAGGLLLAGSILTFGMGAAAVGYGQTNYEDAATYGGMGVMGVVAPLLLGGSIGTFSMLSKRRRNPSSVLSIAQANLLVESYNRSLAEAAPPPPAPPAPSPRPPAAEPAPMAAPEPAMAPEPTTAPEPAAPSLSVSFSVQLVRGTAGLDAVAAFKTALEGKEGGLARCYDAPGKTKVEAKVMQGGGVRDVEATGDAAPCVQGVVGALMTDGVEWNTKVEATITAE